MKHCLHLIVFLWLCTTAVFAQSAVKGEIEDFASKTNAIPTIDKATNSLSFLRFPVGKAYRVNAGDVQQKSMAFLSENSKLFGLRTNEDIYRFKELKTDNYGLDNVTLQQTYKGVPVYDGLLKFHYNKNKDLTSLNGNYISDIKINVVPTLAQNEAEAIAIKYVNGGKIEEPVSPLRAKKSALYVFQKGLVQGYNGPKSLVYEVEVVNDVNIREFLYINAHDGTLVEQFTGIHSINRELYETSYTSANLKWKEGDTFPGALDQWQRSEIETAGFMYNLMKNTFGYVSYNGADAKMITVNNDPKINCPNANWNGVTANYCTGIASDDVVAHEWAHAYTEYTSGLVYAWQSGAMNEAYSDIWGETVDQLDNYFDTGENNTLRTGCGSSVRWRMGEQTTTGALRDMWDPTCNGDPGKVSDAQYWCAKSDAGGVHINSGILNHAYALLVDGGTYNNQTISGIGLTKAAHVFWRAQLIYMTSTTDFAAQADILEAAMSDLIESGANLEGLSTTTTAAGLSGQTMTAFDLLQLQKVLSAVELREGNSCEFQPLLRPVAALCEGASPNLALFYENFEAGLGNFTASTQTSSGSWAARSWVLANAPKGRPGKVAFGVDYQGGNCTSSSNQAGIIRLESPLITIPAETAGNLNMAFDHYVAIEEGWDGGNIKYSINGGAWTLLPEGAFTANGYNTVINATAVGNDNPLQGQRAFSGSDGGTAEGSWGQSQIDLTSIGLFAGNTIKLRWEMGTDGCGGLDGWYVDNISVYTCAVTPAVHFTLQNTTVSEGSTVTGSSGCLNYVDKIVTVQIDKAPTNPVTVTFNTPTGTAKMGATADYTILTPSVILQAGALIQNVIVRVYDDAYVEGVETIDLSYTINANGGNGYAASSFQHHIMTITDDDLAPGNYTEDLLVSGFNSGPGGWEIKNGGNSIDTWEVVTYSNAALDLAGRPFFFIISDGDNTKSGILMDDIIESPVINSAGKKNLVLTFAQDWYPYNGAYAEEGLVDVWDGSVWRNVLTQLQNTGRLGSITSYNANIKTINIPDAYANANMKIRFRYKANWDGWWAVDNVKLTSSNSTAILSTVNTSTAAQEYLGPNETAVFYDPASGNLLAKIKNLSSHDYGCTTVEVDRAGAGGTSWLNSYKITNKTFKVTPANNNAAGNYEITLYYKASELTGFQSEVRSMGKSPGSIGVGNVASTSFAEVQIATAFSADYAYTATFNSGFSGFGLSDALPVGALPVTLAKFEGKNTAEGNVLNWTTTAEVNNEYFAVEKSLTGRNFVEFGRVAGTGNSAVRNDYKFLDTNYPKGVTYYRLKQIDRGGKFAYSRIVSIDALNSRDLKFFPNPVQSVLTMEMPDPEMKSVNVRIINVAGQEVLSRQKVSVTKGSVELDIAKLPTGTYQVILSGETTSYNMSVLKL